jgi:hypothetical protein
MASCDGRGQLSWPSALSILVAAGSAAGAHILRAFGDKVPIGRRPVWGSGPEQKKQSAIALYLGRFARCLIAGHYRFIAFAYLPLPPSGPQGG